VKFSEPDSVLAAAEDMGEVALEAIRQRDAKHDALVAQIEIAQNWAAIAVDHDVERDRLRERVAELEGELEHVRGLAFDLDLRGAIQALLKGSQTPGELRRALAELVR
jgi:ABC-type phosphate transport system auxiliary subunit